MENGEFRAEIKGSRDSRIFKEMDKVGFCCLLQRQKSRALPSEVSTISVIRVRSHFHRYFAHLWSPLVQGKRRRMEMRTTREKGSFWSNKSVLF